MITDEQVEAGVAAAIAERRARYSEVARWPDDFDNEEQAEWRSCMRAALEAAEAAAWRPISEAKRDGLNVLVCDTIGGTQYVASWEEDAGFGDGGVWTVEGMMGVDPTHFRLLPAPPKGDAE